MYVILSGVLLRIIYIVFFVDLSRVEYYEYGALAKNLVEGRGYSIFYIQNDTLQYKYNPNCKPMPSAYMPPGYVLMLAPFFCLENDEIRNLLIFSFNVLLFILTVPVLFKLTRRYFEERVANFAILIYAFLPEFVYLTSQITPTIIYHLFVCCLLLTLSNYEVSKSNRTIFFIAVLLAVLVLVRSEFVLFVIIMFIAFLYSGKWKEVLIIGCMLVVFLLPWVVRNYCVFERFIPLTTSVGLNFYRGHNPYAPGVWSDENLHKKITSLKQDKNFEIEMNSLYFEEAINSIEEGKVNEIINSAEKLFHQWVVNLSYKESRYPIYWVPWLLILGLSIYGVVRSFDLQKFKFFYIFLFYHTLLVILFFSLPRYQVMMKVALLPFACYGIELLIEKYKCCILK